MDEPRRRAYLRAMGVTLWLPRVGAAGLTAGPGPGAAPGSSAGVVGPSASTLFEPIDSGPVGKSDGTEIEVGAASAGGDPAQMDWSSLAQAVRACRACGLSETRTQTVFGVGNREADLMVIGEAPGADEDREGEPFVGRAGQLLNLMLAAIGLPRDRVYIANVLKCRPPGNRDPRPEEVLRCRGYLLRQIELVGPEVILSVGRISAQNLLATDAPVGRLRGRWHSLGPRSIPLRVTYHPAYLLRSPEEKAKAWDDLCAVAQRLGHSAKKD